MYKIEISTVEDREYIEKHDDIIEALRRVARTRKCDDVLGVSIVDMETGEILYIHSVLDSVYIADALKSKFFEEFRNIWDGIERG